MKLFISCVLATSLFLLSCKKEHINLSNQADRKSTSVKLRQDQFIHPFYVRHKTYRKNLNSSFMNHMGYVTDEGC